MRSSMAWRHVSLLEAAWCRVMIRPSPLCTLNNPPPVAHQRHSLARDGLPTEHAKAVLRKGL